MFVYFQEKLKYVSELSTIRKKKGRDDKQKHAAALQRKPARREEKGDPQAGQRGRFFAAGFAVGRVFLVSPVWKRLSFERLRFGLFLGVSLSAAARSAAALVYDKLTPNCHPLFNIAMNKSGFHLKKISIYAMIY